MLKKQGGSTSELDSNCNLPAPLPEKAAVLIPAPHKQSTRHVADSTPRHRVEKVEVGVDTRLAVGGLAIVGGAGVFAAGAGMVVGGSTSAVATPLLIATAACFIAKNLCDGSNGEAFFKKLEQVFKRVSA